MSSNRLLLLSALFCALTVGIADAAGPKQVPQTGGSGTGPTTNPVSVAQGGTGNTTGNAVTATALAANPTDCSANQFATAIDASGNLTCAPPPAVVLSGTTASIGGGLLAAGACATGTVSVTNATTTMAAVASPAAGVDPSNGGTLGVAIDARVSSAGVVTVNVCSPIAGTPAAATYNVRVIP